MPAWARHLPPLLVAVLCMTGAAVALANDQPGMGDALAAAAFVTLGGWLVLSSRDDQR